MKRFSFLWLLPCCGILSGQTTAELKKKSDTYLSFNGSLNSLLSFNANSVSILNAGKPEFTAYTDEFEKLALLLETKKAEDFLVIYQWKKNTHLSQKQLDSLLENQNRSSVYAYKQAALKGKKIAIDPGHFAGDMQTARIEQKFIDFHPSATNSLKDTVRFNEGTLTFQTAEILKQLLLEQGAIVLVTRPKQNYTSFQISYDDWLSKRKKTVLDSLFQNKVMDAKRHTRLMNLSKEKLFWEFFRDYELMERARIINNFKPDATIIIHYNVDEKNTDWINPGTKNFTMAFIGGGMTADNFSKPINKVHFLRLLLSRQLNASEKLSALTVNEFSSKMGIPIAQRNDADYLRDNCMKAPSNGVFCRNLALCRTINSVLVYGECLYQDNLQECLRLNNCDYEIRGQKVPKRIYEAANCYYNAINDYFSKP
jgi:N-acetylmuramoyl-L-alanine amidase